MTGAAGGPAPGARGIRRWLPKTLFGRAMAIVLVPLVLMHAISTFVFFDRHWDTMTRRLAQGLAGDIALVADALTPPPPAGEIEGIVRRSRDLLEMVVAWEAGAVLSAPARPPRDRIEAGLARQLDKRVGRPFRLDTESAPRRVVVRLLLPGGVLTVDVNRKRLDSSTPYVFLMWMLGGSLVLFAIAIVFLRNQIRPVRRLAVAARALGMGREVGHFRMEGATEVRQAAEAFLQMRERIRRQMAQRTEMLAGVSHDLRTPLTRMKLQLAMLGDDPEIAELRADVRDMERMVEGYLAFARGEGEEAPRRTDLAALVAETVEAERRDGSAVALEGAAEAAGIVLEVRPQAIKRALANLVGNAKRHAGAVSVSLLASRGAVAIVVDDNGPGVPEAHREDVFKPFFRLDASRSPGAGGAGLGLAIARDIARGHGGDLTLDDAPAGGLRAVLRLPV